MAERRELNDVRGRSLQLWLQPLLERKEEEEYDHSRGMLIQLYIYQLLKEKKRRELVRFEKRTSERYSEYVGGAGWRYGGAHLALGLERSMIAYLLTTEAGESVDAAERISPGPSLDVREMLAERSLYVDARAPHYSVRLTPVATPPRSEESRLPNGY